MEIEIEGLVRQLGYNLDEKHVAQMRAIVENTQNFKAIKTHILALNDHLHPLESFVAMSNSENYLKAKIDTRNEARIKEASEVIHKWATKYKVRLQKVANKDTYYILGRFDDWALNWRNWKTHSRQTIAS